MIVTALRHGPCLACAPHLRHALTIVIGLHEIDSGFSGTTLFNTVIVIGPDGKLLNRHRKLMPTNPERMVSGMGDATGLKVVDTPAGRLGCLICWESYMPLARYALYAQGMEIFVNPTWDNGDLSGHVAAHRQGSRILGHRNGHRPARQRPAR
jgi:predicted amidohydrolase